MTILTKLVKHAESTSPFVKKTRGAPWLVAARMPQKAPPRKLTVVWVFKQELLTLTIIKILELDRTPPVVVPTCVNLLPLQLPGRLTYLAKLPFGFAFL